jgi:hypothetical protein
MGDDPNQPNAEEQLRALGRRSARLIRRARELTEQSRRINAKISRRASATAKPPATPPKPD